MKPSNPPSAPPFDSDAALMEVLVHHLSARFTEAADGYRRILASDPRYGDARYGLGVLALQQGRIAESLTHLKAALEVNPDHGQYWLAYTDALARAGHHEAALSMRAQAIARGGSNLGAWAVSAADYQHMADSFHAGKFADLEDAARTLTMNSPGDGVAWKSLGAAILCQGAGASAIEPLRQAMRLLPQDAAVRHNLASAYRVAGNQRAAEMQLRAAIGIDAESAEAHASLAMLLAGQRRYVEATACYRQALRIAPDNAQNQNNAGTALAEIGNLAEAEACFARAVCIKPDYDLAQSNWLLTMNYNAAHAPDYVLKKAQEYGAMIDRRVGRQYSEWRCTDPSPRLRVGFVSGDFGDHPVGYFLEGMLDHIDADQFELIAYPTHVRDEPLTRRIRDRFSAWKPLVGLDDATAAGQIHADGVQVLIDLAGHTTDNRLPVFAHRPAPVQVSWLGYFATTGLTEMDYFLADRVGVPDANRGHFTEQIWYLPETRLCFTAPLSVIPVSPLPALRNGHVTFGCFQNIGKAGEAVLAAWASILKQLPEARLRIQSRQLGEVAARESLVAQFERLGIEALRLSLHPGVSRDEYLAAHGEVDIILDTFPFPGGTTTCEALWMGVPTVTLAGERMLSRQGASILSAAGFADWVATDEPAYVAMALLHARDLAALAAIRAGLRKHVAGSALFDGERFARHFSAALSGMWTRFQQAKT